MKEAIEKAIEGGWKFLNSESVDVIAGGETARAGLVLPARITAHWNDGYCRNVAYGEILMDSRFWQALGESLKWHEDPIGDFHRGTVWVFYWHSFITHLSEGKDVDSFFNNLLN